MRFVRAIAIVAGAAVLQAAVVTHAGAVSTQAAALTQAGTFKSQAGGRSGLSLGGIAVGSSILDAAKVLGMPDVVQTTDDGHVWQWSDAGGLDREVLTDDDLVVESVLVAPCKVTSAAQPAEFPVLGLSARDAERTIDAIAASSSPGSSAVDTIASPEAVNAHPSTHVWRFAGGVLVTELNQERVVRIRALDVRTARIRGYVWPALHAPAHRAPVLAKRFMPQTLPPGAGTVIVRVDLDANGSVTRTRVVQGSGDAAIDDFEVDSMRRSSFLPASCDGVPCAGVYLDIGGISR